MYSFKNDLGEFFILDYKGKEYFLSGSIAAATKEFQKIGKQPPGKYGNWYRKGDEEFVAIKSLIEHNKGG